MKKDSRIYKYIKTLIKNKKYLMTEDIMLMLQKYFKLPINKGPVFYKYKKVIREIRQEVYRERQKEKKEKRGNDRV